MSRVPPQRKQGFKLSNWRRIQSSGRLQPPRPAASPHPQQHCCVTSFAPWSPPPNIPHYSSTASCTWAAPTHHPSTPHPTAPTLWSHRPPPALPPLLVLAESFSECTAGGRVRHALIIKGNESKNNFKHKWYQDLKSETCDETYWTILFALLLIDDISMSDNDLQAFLKKKMYCWNAKKIAEMLKMTILKKRKMVTLPPIRNLCFIIRHSLSSISAQDPAGFKSCCK